MNYQDWLDSIDQILRAAGRGYGTAQIDPSHLQAAFQQGTSPVIYARQANHPMRPVQPQYPVPPAPVPANLPPLDYRRASYIVKFLDGFGWIFQVVGWGIVVLWIFALLLGGVGAGASQNSAGAAIGSGIMAFLGGAMLTLAMPFTGLSVVFMGVVCWWQSGIFRSLYKSQ